MVMAVTAVAREMVTTVVRAAVAMAVETMVVQARTPGRRSR
jgi:hypothetical protein